MQALVWTVVSLAVVAYVVWQFVRIHRRHPRGFMGALGDQMKAEIAKPHPAAVSYLGGHPLLVPGAAQVWHAGDTITVQVGRRRVAIDADKVKGRRFIPRSQVVATGGGVGLSGLAVGAIAGNAIAGDLGEAAGAIIGSRGRTRTKVVRQDMAVLEAMSENGTPVELYFIGSGGAHGWCKPCG